MERSREPMHKNQIRHRSPTSTGSACLGAHNVNYSNRAVRTRMPGGGDRLGYLTASIWIVVSAFGFENPAKG